jgi:hypothetical protein
MEGDIRERHNVRVPECTGPRLNLWQLPKCWCCPFQALQTSCCFLPVSDAWDCDCDVSSFRAGACLFRPFGGSYYCQAPQSPTYQFSDPTAAAAPAAAPSGGADNNNNNNSGRRLLQSGCNKIPYYGQCGGCSCSSFAIASFRRRVGFYEGFFEGLHTCNARHRLSALLTFPLESFESCVLDMLPGTMLSMSDS